MHQPKAESLWQQAGSATSHNTNRQTQRGDKHKDA